MDYPSSPSSSSSSSSVHSSISTEYPQSAENSSEEAYSSESSGTSSQNNPQHAYITSPSSSTNNRSFFPPHPPLLTDARRSSAWRLEGPRRERGRRLDLSYYEVLASFMRRGRCMRHYLAWNDCMDEALRTGQDSQLMCASLARCSEFASGTFRFLHD